MTAEAHPPIDRSKVLLIGWDAADWKVIHPLIDAGKMPNLERFISEGVMGNIATLQPCLSPMLWTSIATGKRAYKHGIHGFSEPDPVSGSIRPVTNLSRKTKAIWNILNQENKHTITVGWWPSNPAEPLSKGVMVSNDYQRSTNKDPEKWTMPSGTIHPERLSSHLAPLRFHPSELTEDEFLAFMPGLKGLNQEQLDQAAKDPRVQSLAKTIADCTSIQSAATALMQNEPWDLMCVYFDAIDHFGHAFMKYHPPQRPDVDDWDYRLFHQCVEAGYIYHDMMLGTLLELAGKDTTVVLLSDHGFHPDDFRLNAIPREPAGPAAEHRQFGIFAAKGPGIRKDQRIAGASLLDICPTLLHLFGLPVGDDMDGKVLTDIYENPEPVSRIPSWDQVEGDHGMHPPDRQISPTDSNAALQQLVALGYIDRPDDDHSKALDETVRELDYNLAQAWTDGGIFSEAATILERLYEKWPMEHRFGFKLAQCYQFQNRLADLRAMVATVSKNRLQEAEEASLELKALQLDIDANRDAEKQRFEKMSDPEKQNFSLKRNLLIKKASPNLFSLRYLEASADFAESKYQDALEKLAHLESDFGARRNGLILRGEILQRLRRFPEARAAFEEALSKDRENPGPLLGLARTALAERDYRSAIDHASASLGLLYFQPRAHYIIGLSYYRLGEWELAEEAFIICIKQAPLFSAALRYLEQIARIYHKDAMLASTLRLKMFAAREQTAALGKKKLSEISQLSGTGNRSQDESISQPMPELFPRPAALADVAEKDIITIVSGLPRSGTSLMMQLLIAAGIPAFTDRKRLADDSNQQGYFEHEKITTLLTTPAAKKDWLAESRGHALKVVAPLLASLPLNRFPGDSKKSQRLHYRIIFMERPVSEILSSQQAMLKRLARDVPGGDPAKAYQQQVRHAKNWITGNGISAISISYPDLVHQPESILKQLADFIEKPDSVKAMLAVINPSLHRERTLSSN